MTVTVKSHDAASFIVRPHWRAVVLVGGGALLALISWALMRAALGLAPAEPMFTPVVAVHLATIVPAIPIGMVLLLSRKGTRRHRRMGVAWMTLMMLAAATSFGIRHNNGGALSWIHLFSAYTLVAVPAALWAIRSRRVELHARLLKGLFAGALIVAGLFTFVPGRIMYRWAFG